ncbi:MAG: phosphate acyltransferase [Desulfobacteraceae bacterium]|nr:phosphate acyltransferase [Desulfobacteraceae bacterium]
MRKIIIRAQQNPLPIVLPEGNHPVIIRAAYQALAEGIARPLLLGDPSEIHAVAKKIGISIEGIDILDPRCNPHLEGFEAKLFAMRQRKGWSLTETQRQLQKPYIFGAMLVREGLVDGQVHGIAQSYPNAIRPVLQVIPRMPSCTKVAGLYLMISKNHTLLFADTTVNIHPSAEDLAEIAIMSSEMALFFGMTPRVAMLSFSNFGSVRHPDAQRVADAVQIARAQRPGLIIDGEMHADTALVRDRLMEGYPFNQYHGRMPNVLIFPNLSSGNIGYKLVERLGNAKAVGPLLMGLSKPFNVLQRDTDMENVVNVMAITVAQAQNNKA